MLKREFNVAVLIALACVACGAGERSSAINSSAVPDDGASLVQVDRQQGKYRLLRNGQPYRINGAGIEFGDIGAFAAHGGTSFRTWRTDNGLATGQEILDEAELHGLTVVMCIEIGRERQGFDYDDEAAVAAQLEYARGEVLKYKSHPALLAWIIGNEPNLHFENPKVFDAINEISAMIHEVDGNHPTTTALAGFSEELAGLIESRAPDLDFVSIQMYGDIVNLPTLIDDIGFDQPYFVTEWGAIGHWEVAKTAWDAPIEQNSSEKAQNYLVSYERAIGSNPQQIIGSFVFLWGQKQERTPTWYGMFLEDGAETETIDVMHYIWNGQWPDNRSPKIESMLLDSKTAHENVVLAPGGRYGAGLLASDPDGDALSYRWEIMQESGATQTGGDREDVPEALPDLIGGGSRANVEVTAPAEQGAYRLFVYVYDDRGRAGHANIPFLVR